MIAKPFVYHPPGKNWMIAFEETTQKETIILNSCIKRVMNELELRPFHQIGTDNTPGFHAWEAWGYCNEETLQNTAIPIIISEANDMELVW